MKSPDQLVSNLFDGPLDIVGDVHGEIDALDALLKTTGYDRHGEHPAGRRLVFVGDLIDRGPDSPAVVERVSQLMGRGLAQCVLGNHELNALQWDAKSGNRWLLDPNHAEQQPGGEFCHSRVAPPSFEEPLLKFLGSLPLALERPDLRVVHAAWVGTEVDVLRDETRSSLEVYRAYETATERQLSMEGLSDRAADERSRWKKQLRNAHTEMELLTALGEHDERIQMGNPVRVLTSGIERLAARPFWSSGQWRMCDRVRWWNEYQQDAAVVIGHYWRRLRPIGASAHASSNPDLFHDVHPLEWMGPNENVFCVDYSVGARYEERKEGRTAFATRLAAIRWPEREVWGENGLLTAA